MARVADILAGKGGHVHCVDRAATVHEAIQAMVAHNVGSLVVLDGDEIAGIFTERDFLRRIAVHAHDPREIRVGEVMTEEVVCLDPSWTVDECMSVMTHQRIRHLPVIEGKRLAGMVSIGDLVKHVSDEREVEVRLLTEYITGKYPA